MTRRDYKGGAPQITLNGNIAASGVTTINTTGTVTAWPSATNGKFLIVIDKGTASEEKIYCNGRTGNALSVASDADRGADGTTASSHTSGATINHVGGAIDLDEPNAHINVTANDDHTQYLNNARHDITARHAFGSAYGTPGTPTDVAPGTAASGGSAGGPPHSDHVHGLASGIAKGRVAYTAKTSAYSLTTSTTDIPSLSATFTTLAGRAYRVSLVVPLNIGVVSIVTLSIQEGATVLAQWSGGNADTGSIYAGTGIASAILTPSAASHTYKATGVYVTGGAGSGTVNPAATNPAYIMIEDIGV